MSIDAKGRRHVNVMVGGKRVHRVLPEGATAGDAKLLEASLRAALGKTARQARIPSDPPMTYVMSLYAEHAAHLSSGKETMSSARRVGPWAEKYRASQAREFAKHFIKDTRAKYKPASINRSLHTVKKALSLAWEQDLTTENYGAKIKTLTEDNKREVYLTVAEVRAIARHCVLHMQALIWAALLTGARRGELFKLQPKFIHADHVTFTATTTKTKRTRDVPIIPALHPWLEHFPMSLHAGFTPAIASNMWDAAREKEGMQHVHFHDLRHSCASLLINNGVELYTVGKILGHVNVQTTQRYAHLQIGAQRTALEKLSNLVLE